MRCEDLDNMIVRDDPERFFQVGAQLPLNEKEELVELLRRNVDVFAWDAYETSGLDPKFICHHLNVNPLVTPKRQPPRRPFNEHVEAVKSEVIKLKQTGAIKEVFYPQWLANTVVVKKKTGKWHVCVDFTDLNKACPKDPFPMPRIDQLVDATIGHPWMRFFGCLSRLSPDTIGNGRLGKDSFCYSCGELPLQSNAFWPEKCRINLSTDDYKNV